MRQLYLYSKRKLYPALSSALLIFCMFIGSSVKAQDCGNLNCTSNDVRVIRAYISGPENTAINCEDADPFAGAELHLIVSSNTQRVGVSVSGLLVPDNNDDASESIGRCFTGLKLNNGSDNNLTYELGNQLNGLTCASSFKLKNVFTSWGTGNTNFCTSTNPQCPATPAKCRYVPGEVINVDIKLEVDFSWLVGNCSSNTRLVSFESELDLGADIDLNSITYKWDFNEDGIADATTADPSHSFNAPGTYPVTLTVNATSGGHPIAPKSITRNVVIEACCNLTAPDVSGGIFCSAEGKKFSDLNPSADGGYFTWVDKDGFEVDANTLIPIGTNTYWVSYSKNGCESERTEVTITVNSTPVAPTVTAGPFCSAEGKTIGDLPQGDGAYKYYDAETGGNLVAGATVIPVGTNTYWVSTTSGDCESARTQVTVIVKQSPTLVVNSSLANVCPSKTVDLTKAVISATAGTVTYFTSAGTVVTTPTAVGAGTYKIKLTSNGCTDEKTVTVRIDVCWGCTPGYWKNRKQSWSTIRTLNDELSCINAATGLSLVGDLKAASFWTVFNLTSLSTSARELRTGKGTNTLTLLAAVGLGDGSGYTQLARAATAALLNSCALKGSPSGYPYTSAEILSWTKDVFLQPITNASRQAALDLAKKFDIANNGVCIIDNSGKAVTSANRASTYPVIEEITELSVSTLPNPFHNNVRFVVNNPKAGQGSLEVFNMLGQKVKTVYRGFIPAGTQTYQLNVPSTSTGNMIYRLNVGSQQVTGKLLRAKE